MDKTINFSHNYHKLWNQRRARLIALKIINRKDIHPDLLEYDTRFLPDWPAQYYPLPEGILIQLFFIGDKGIPFCTIRRHTVDKERYYRSMLRQEFEIVYKNQYEEP
jgi:hypothetical protein